MFFTNGGNITLLVNRGIPCLYWYIKVVETSQLLQVKILSGSRVPFSGHYFLPLTQTHKEEVVWSERKSLHFNPMGIRKFHPITVKPVTVMGFYKLLT